MVRTGCDLLTHSLSTDGTEHEFTSYFFPNVAERNHVDNTVEQLVVNGGDSYFVDGEFYFFEVYGSTDSAFSTMEYTLSVETNYAPHLLLKRVLLIVAFGPQSRS